MARFVRRVSPIDLGYERPFSAGSGVKLLGDSASAGVAEPDLPWSSKDFAAIKKSTDLVANVVFASPSRARPLGCYRPGGVTTTMLVECGARHRFDFSSLAVLHTTVQGDNRTTATTTQPTTCHLIVTTLGLVSVLVSGG